MGTYYEVSSGSDIYIQNDTSIGVLRKGIIGNCGVSSSDQKCTTSIQVSLSSTNNGGEENVQAWILYDTSDDNKIVAYCDDESASFTSCNQWFVWNEDSYMKDSSFDVDIDECMADGNFTISDDEFNEYTESLCFQLNVTTVTKNDELVIYSDAQYLWGSYIKMDKENTFGGKPIYENVRLQDTDFDTYLVWYDPRDSWIFLTKFDFITNTSDPWAFNTQILDDFEDFNDFSEFGNTKVVTGWCERFDVENDEYVLPEYCQTWSLIDDKTFNASILSLVPSPAAECGDGVIGFNVSLEEEDIQEICVAFYDQYEDGKNNPCQVPPESKDILTGVNYCDGGPPQNFEETDWCNKTIYGECDVIDANGIYSDNIGEEDNIPISDRSYWVRQATPEGDEYDDDDEIVFFYTYYHEYLRIWVYATDGGDNEIRNGSIIESFDELNELPISAWCQKWDLNAPCIIDLDEASQGESDYFYYTVTNDDDSVETVSTLAVVINCDLSTKGDDLGGYISVIIIASCFGLACCVFFIGFYKEYMEKQAKKRAAQQSILSDSSNGSHVIMAQSINLASTQVIEEENEDDDDNEDNNDDEDDDNNDAEKEDDENRKLTNKVQSASDTDAVGYAQ